ncbi:hypothetical protein Hanom_Chr02g00109451 [Helianthus anomalus]
MLVVSWNVRVSNKAIVIPVVEVEPPRCSYNPSSERFIGSSCCR